MRRLFFLVPDANLTRQLVGELLDAGVAPTRIHVVSQEPLHLEALPDDGDVHQELRHEVKRGAEAGGTAGAVAGLAAVALPGGVLLAGGALLAMAALGAGVGALVAGLTGQAAEEEEVGHFTAALERGEVLLLVDVPREELESIESLVQRIHPEVKIQGTEPRGTFPAP